MTHVVVVPLIPDASDALNELEISKGHTEVDLMNAAIQLSARVERKLSEGFELAFVKRDRKGDVTDIEIAHLKKE